MRTLFTTLVALTCACQQEPLPPRPPVTLALRLVMRASCGAENTLNYDTSCLAALHFRVRDAARNEVFEECRPLADERPTMRSIVNGESLISYAGLSTNKSYSFEVTGLHARYLDGEQERALCDNPDETSAWLFWGQSELIDLTQYDQDDAGSPFIPIVVDCRDCATDDEEICPGGGCFGCLAITEAPDNTCPAVFPPSVCAPASTFLCGKACRENGDCFEGAQQCIDERCFAGNTAGNFCSTCTSADTCADGLHCVGRPGDTIGFCAPLCPLPDETCLTGTKCTRLGNGIVDIGVE